MEKGDRIAKIRDGVVELLSQDLLRLQEKHARLLVEFLRCKERVRRLRRNYRQLSRHFNRLRRRRLS